jgi:hypothetical protein
LETGFLAVTLFEKSVMPHDNYVNLALASISVAAKLDDPRESGINFKVLYEAAREVELDTWQCNLKFISLESLCEYEKLVLQRLNYNLLYITSATFVNIYISFLFKPTADASMIQKIYNLLTLLQSMPIMRKYYPSSLCLSSIYFVCKKTPGLKFILPQRLPGFNITDIIKIISDFECATAYDILAYIK